MTAIAHAGRRVPRIAGCRQARGVGHSLGGVMLGLSLLCGSADAQFPAQPRGHLDWRSAETEHFVFHYPMETEAWTLDVARRFEGVHQAVSRYVGWSPGARVHVIVEDPAGISNGSAWPVLDIPAILLWPTPPGPTSSIGHSRGWGEILAVHEYAHIAHLTRPSRRPLRRTLMSLLPVATGPVAIKAPRWVIEGYATVVEGALTGSGRPFGVMRPALLRQRALEGRLPTYAQLNAFEGYAGGSMAYLAGSAYLEWLAARSGDSALVHLWRRMSARHDRGFADAFAGVFGDAPQALYGRFTAELTAHAIAVEDTLRAAGLVAGDTVLALDYGTGAPSISPGDSLLAAVVRFRDRAPEIMVWETRIDTAALRRRARERERVQARDPEDVPAVDMGPPPRRRVATLAPLSGSPYDAPRFLRDGRRLLVWRSEPLGDGAWRGDIGIWDLATGSVRRITHGAGVQDAVPLRDGRAAVAVRCANGLCDLVEIDLATGTLTILAPGTFDSPWVHPSPSPDDRWIAASRMAGGTWEIVLVERILDDAGRARAGTIRPLTFGDSASRYQPAWLTAGPAGPGLIVVSERGGVANLEVIPLESPDATPGSPRTITRVTGAALGPSVPASGTGVYFLSMHANGLSVQRLALADSTDPARPNRDLARAANVVTIPPARAFAAPRAAMAADTLVRGSVTTRGAYGIGPRRYALWPSWGAGASGGYGGLAFVSSDPVGRLTWMVQGVYGKRALWRGGAAGAVWRGARPAFSGSLFYAEQRPSRQSRVPVQGLDVDYRGGTLMSELPRFGNGWSAAVRVGGSAGRLSAPGDSDDESRSLALAELGGEVVVRGGRRTLVIAGSVHGTAGRTGGEIWRRGLASIGARAAAGRRSISGSITAGTVTGDAPPFERFVVGGMPSPLLDASFLSQHLSHPALPLGITSGTDVIVWRGATRMAAAEVYLWNASARGWRNEQHRLVGLEYGIGELRLPIINVPGISARFGAAYSIDRPFRREARVYGGVRLAP